MKFNKDKDTNADDLDEVHKIVLNSVQSNIAEFVQVDKCGAIDVDNPNDDNFCVVQLTSMPYTLHVDLIEDNETIKSGTIVSKANKLCQARADLTWFLEPKECTLPTIIKLQHVLVADLYVKVVKKCNELDRSVKTLTQEDVDNRHPFHVGHIILGKIHDEQVRRSRIEYEIKDPYDVTEMNDYSYFFYVSVYINKM
jgi:hypothetical protein